MVKGSDMRRGPSCSVRRGSGVPLPAEVLVGGSAHPRAAMTPWLSCCWCRDSVPGVLTNALREEMHCPVEVVPAERRRSHVALPQAVVRVRFTLRAHDERYDDQTMNRPSVRPRLRDLVSAHRDEIEDVVARHGASNPRLFGSVARGEEHPGSDVDIVVDVADGVNSLMAVAGIGAELTKMLGVEVDVVSDRMLRDGVSESVSRDALSL